MCDRDTRLGITGAQVDELKQRLLGTCESVERAMDALCIDDVEPGDAEDRLLDVSVERCGGCEWWFESCMLEFSETKNAPFCDDCRGSHDE